MTGGAGYVGSSTAAWLIGRGHDVWILDDLSTGHLELTLGRGFTRARLGDLTTVVPLLRRENFDCVMHFAAKSLVAESVARPALYFENNVEQTRLLLEAMVETSRELKSQPRFIFSSTCAIFGDPGDRAIAESLPKNPTNPYGATKLEVEGMLQKMAAEQGLQSVALRYFNAAGTEALLRVGEIHEPETHLIPNILKAVTEDRPVQIFGTDYPTPDGTCVRDYVHVSDLAAAHEAAMNRLLAKPQGGSFEAFNLGSEAGFSVREMISACERVVGKKIQTVEKPRRPGDPPRLVADSSLAKKELGFKARSNSLESILASAWAWHRKQAEPRRAILLDRDGTLNVDPGYLDHPDKLQLFPGVAEALAKLKRAGFRLIVVSNQSGVGRGLIPPEMLPKIHERLGELLKPYGVQIDHYALCIHHPDANCDCRKPKPKLLLDAAQHLNVDLTRSFMVGDKKSDVEAGRAALCGKVALVLSGCGRDAEKELALSSTRPDFTGESLEDIARWILSSES